MENARSLPATYWPATRNLLGLTSLALLAFTLARVILTHRAGFGDVYAYYEAWPDLYRLGVGGAHAYLYSPAFAQAIWPLTLLPFPTFYGLLLAADVAALIYLVGWRWAGWVAILYPVSLEMSVGNIHLLLAASIALAMQGGRRVRVSALLPEANAYGGHSPGKQVFHRRHSALRSATTTQNIIASAWWAFSLLTKVTSGVGLLYELWRPRRFLVGLGVTAGIVAVSAALAPNLWVEWFALLRSSSGVVDPWAMIDVPLLPRLPVAVGLVLLAGWRRWPWLVPAACLVAMPVIWVGSVVLLLAIPRLVKPGDSEVVLLEARS